MVPERDQITATRLPSKRRISSVSDDSDFDDETGCADIIVGSPLSNSASDDSGCYTNARKKRRGLIEKRRRDRINKSLNDLKNLIPAATERQASTKLEKSEVLSLAVDHIKSLTIKAESANPQTLAQDYRSIGYRECLHELMGYLTHGEGVGPAAPIHGRIVSHLQQQLAHSEQKSFLQPAQCPPHPGHVINRLHVPNGNTFDSGFYEPAVQCKSEPGSSPPCIESNQLQNCNFQYPTDYSLSNSDHFQWQGSPSGPPQSTGQYMFGPQASWI